MRIILLIALILITGISAISQNLIGYNSREIKDYMKENRGEMNLNTVTNTRYRYLKYSDNSDNQTLLFFLSPDSICNSIRMICDRSIISEKKKEFDANYTKNGKNCWIEKRDKKIFIIELKEEEWSCVFTIKPEKYHP